MSEEETVIAKTDINGQEQLPAMFSGFTKFAEDNPEAIDKGLELANKGMDVVAQGVGELARGTGNALGSIGQGTGVAIGAIGQGVGQTIKIVAATPAMIAKFRAEQKNLETLGMVRLAELASKCKTWAHAFDTEASQRGQSLAMVEKVLDKAITDNDREAMLKSMDAIIGTLEKTDLTRHSNILTEEWKGTTLPNGDSTPQVNLLEDDSKDFDPGF